MNLIVTGVNGRCCRPDLAGNHICPICHCILPGCIARAPECLPCCCIARSSTALARPPVALEPRAVLDLPWSVGCGPLFGVRRGVGALVALAWFEARLERFPEESLPWQEEHPLLRLEDRGWPRRRLRCPLAILRERGWALSAAPDPVPVRQGATRPIRVVCRLRYRATRLAPCRRRSRWRMRPAAMRPSAAGGGAKAWPGPGTRMAGSRRGETAVGSSTVAVARRRP